jgi:2-(1,2-epoxy-1,2-dihydrophenyl)acetyl-CoA isomerase
VSEDDGAPVSAGAVTAIKDGAVLRIELDRPQRRNALSHDMIRALVGVLQDAATDDGLRAIHIRGTGADFCSGADWVATNATGARPRTGDLTRRIPLQANRIIELVHSIALPVVCSVRGWAVGLGCNLALAADFTIGAEDAVFWQPFISRGFSPDSGSTWLVPRLVGVARARRMLLLGEQVAGSTAGDWGLIHQAVPTEQLDEATEALLARLASGPTVAVGLAKQAINTGLDSSLESSMKQELFDLELSCRTADFKEGLAAFREHRPPRFDGR